MSWFLGIVWRSPQHREAWMHLAPAKDCAVVDQPDLSIYSAGAEETSFLKDTGSEVCVGVGTPISGLAEGTPDVGWSDSNATRIINNEWMDGHFAFIHQRTDGTTTLCIDHFGLRSVFAYRHEAGIVFSTNLSRLVKWVSSPTINANAFSSHWLGHNQLSHECLVDGIVRLPPGHKMVIRDSAIRIQDAEPDPPNDCSVGELIDTILNVPSQISLGLSGGLDSRFLLSQLIRSRRRFGLHVWGHDDDPDVSVATALAASISEPVSRPNFRYSHEEQIQSISAFAQKMGCSAPATTSLVMDNFRVITDAGLTVVDGAFGEIFRRQYYNRLVFAGLAARSSKPEKTLAKISQSLRFHRADIFSTYFNSQLEIHFKEHMQEIVAALNQSKISLPDFADNLAIKYRLSNFFGYGQSWMDESGVSLMPLAQPSLVRTLLQSTTWKQRRGGKLVRNMIRRDAPNLTRLPLVKGSTAYPFSLGPGGAYLWTRFVSKRKRTDRIDNRISNLIGLREWVLDVMKSRSVMESQYLDRKKVSSLTRSFYSEDYSTATELDWLLSFVLWIRGLKL